MQNGSWSTLYYTYLYYICIFSLLLVVAAVLFLVFLFFLFYYSRLAEFGIVPKHGKSIQFYFFTHSHMHHKYMQNIYGKCWTYQLIVIWCRFFTKQESLEIQKIDEHVLTHRFYTCIRLFLCVCDKKNLNYNYCYNNKYKRSTNRNETSMIDFRESGIFHFVLFYFAF